MKRPYCPQCRNPLPRCFCPLVSQVTPAVEVVFWQHPSEAGHPKGTLPLVHQCLTNSRVISSERLSQEAFTSALGAASPERQLQLLFPASAEDPSVTTAELEQRPGHIRLLVLDGTWRKARKLLHVNPWLLTLPRRSLAEGISSRYVIRKAEKSGQLSTLEATCAALAQIEDKPDLVVPILTAFEHYISQLNHFRPKQP